MTAIQHPFSLEDWRKLGPTHLPSYRETKYEAENERRSLKDFAEKDRRILQAAYRTLLDLFLELKPCYQDSRVSHEILARFFENGKEAELEEKILSFGKETLAHPGPTDCAKAIHDLRGGSFQALILRMAVFNSFAPRSQSLRNIYFLLRDHLKIMRNCVDDLDPDRYTGDGVKKDHATSLLVDKWSMADFGTVEKPVQVVVDCSYQGTLCESCLEFSTLDRIIYNLMDNAARHTTDGLVHFGLLPVPEEKPDSLRLVIANTLSSRQRDLLHDAFPNDLTNLFQGGFTTGGHGLGARICADFCAQAYGIDEFEEARKGGHFGAKIIGDYFVAWFHWPIKSH